MITRAEAIRKTTVTTREMVNIVLPLTVTVKSMRRSLGTILHPVVIRSNVAVTVKSKINTRKVMTYRIRRLALGSVLRVYHLSAVIATGRRLSTFSRLRNLSKYFIDPELIRRVGSRMLEYTKVGPPMEKRAAEDSMLHGIAKGILLVIRRGTDDLLRKVKLPIVLVPGLKRNVFSGLAAAPKSVKTFVEKNGSYLDLGSFSVQLTRRFDNMDHLNLLITIANESRTKSAFLQLQEKRLVKSLY